MFINTNTIWGPVKYTWDIIAGIILNDIFPSETFFDIFNIETFVQSIMSLI